MIYEFTNQADADAIAEPKHVWINGDVIVVYTESDIPVVEMSRIIPAYAFRDRFTDKEMDAILDLAYSGDKVARVLLLKLQTANDGIDLSSQTTLDGLNYLLSKSVITPERKIEILV